MGKVLVFLYDNMADFEMTFPATAMKWIKKEVITIAYTKDTVTANSNLQYHPHMTVEEALSLTDVLGLIIPGGWELDLREDLKNLINKLNSEGKLLSAICAGPQYLAKAGVLNEVKFTTTLSKDELEKQNKADYFNWKNFVRQNVVRDKNIVTALGNAFIDFSMELIDFFNGFKDQNQKDAYISHYKGL